MYLVEAPTVKSSAATLKFDSLPPPVGLSNKYHNTANRSNPFPPEADPSADTACGACCLRCPFRTPHADTLARSVAIPRLSELFSELTWRVVGGTLPVGHATAYLLSEKPFQTRLPGDSVGAAGADSGGAGSKVGEEEWRVDPIVECLCDTLWGVDAMVSIVGFVRVTKGSRRRQQGSAADVRAGV